jgi:hypothetical protein
MASHLFSLLKYKGVNCELINEFAKEKTWENNSTALSDQFYITACQHYKQHILIGKVDVIITDSPIILGLFYYKDQVLINPLYDTNKLYKELVLAIFHQQNNMNYFVNRDKPYNPNGRNQTEEQAKELDRTIKEYLDKHFIHYTNVIGVEEDIEIIRDEILGKLDWLKTWKDPRNKNEN